MKSIALTVTEQKNVMSNNPKTIAALARADCKGGGCKNRGDMNRGSLSHPSLDLTYLSHHRVALFYIIRWKKEEGRRKREDGRGKKEEGRGKMEEGKYV